MAKAEQIDLPGGWRRAYRVIERISGAILAALGWLLVALLWRLPRHLLGGLWAELVATLRQVRSVVVDWLLRKALWGLLIAFGLVWAANGFSLTKAFSWEGLQVVIRMLQ